MQKKQYSTPKLMEYGDVKALTLTGGDCQWVYDWAQQKWVLQCGS